MDRGSLVGTSVTVVLIGAQTYHREWVRFEIKRSFELGKGLLGIRIHNIEDPVSGTDVRGRNPLDYWTIERGGQRVPLSSLAATYDWLTDNGRANISEWIDRAATRAGR